MSSCTLCNDTGFVSVIEGGTHGPSKPPLTKMKCNCDGSITVAGYSFPWRMLDHTEPARGTSMHSTRHVEELKKDAAIVTGMLELGDQRLLASDGPAGGQLPELSPEEWGKVYRACKRIGERAAKFLSSENARGWISVLERLPASGDVLCARNDGGVDIYRHDLVRDYAVDDTKDTRDSHITHWMPIPEAPHVRR